MICGMGAIGAVHKRYGGSTLGGANDCFPLKCEVAQVKNRNIQNKTKVYSKKMFH